jgi:hypothetical protein
MRRTTLGILLLAATTATAACAGNDVTSPTVTLAGTYNLRTINGTALPYNFGSGAVLTSDVLTLRNDGTYTDVGRWSDGSTTTEQGAYSNSGGAITFDDYTDNVTYQGSLSGRVLTEITNGYTVTYQKN